MKNPDDRREQLLKFARKIKRFIPGIQKAIRELSNGSFNM